MRPALFALAFLLALAAPAAAGDRDAVRCLNAQERAEARRARCAEALVRAGMDAARAQVECSGYRPPPCRDTDRDRDHDRDDD